MNVRGCALQKPRPRPRQSRHMLRAIWPVRLERRHSRATCEQASHIGWKHPTHSSAASSAEPFRGQRQTLHRLQRPWWQAWWTQRRSPQPTQISLAMDFIDMIWKTKNVVRCGTIIRCKNLIYFHNFGYGIIKSVVMFTFSSQYICRFSDGYSGYSSIHVRKRSYCT